MDNNNTSKKLHQNTSRVIALSTLAKIKKIVDRLEEQDRNDKKHLLLILIITIILAIAAAYLFTNSDNHYQHIHTNINNTIDVLTFLT